MRLEDLDYVLPPDRIAQVPAARREAARLLVLDRAAGALVHHTVAQLPSLLAPGDLVVANDTRVRPARLFARRATGGRVELLLVDAAGEGRWRALASAGGRLRAGETLAVAPEADLRLVRREPGGTWVVEAVAGELPALMERHGRMPLPPYIDRAEADARDPLDRERYQTVFAREEGAIAAPTAGLHLTPGLLDALEARGVETAFVTLHVGRGTFEPVRADRLDAHRMHAEDYRVPEAAAAAVRRARSEGRRVVAVGTTSVRALEAAAAGAPDGLPAAGAGTTALLIAPGYRFRVVDALLTNFHLPRSTLLALVFALAGRERTLGAYREAIDRGYRFYSYGDAMLVL